MIPREFHAIWFGSDLPLVYAGYLERWAELHPDYTMTLWTEDNLPPLINQQLFDEAEEIVPAHAVGQFRADVARYEILATYGGIYVDVDLEPLRPIGPLLARYDDPFPRRGLIAWEVDDVWVNNAFVALGPGHPLATYAIRDLPGRARRHRGSTASVISGPKMITPLALGRVKHHDLFILPSRLVYPYAHDELGRSSEEFPEAYMVHHWNHQRELQERPIHDHDRSRPNSSTRH